MLPRRKATLLLRPAIVETGAWVLPFRNEGRLTEVQGKGPRRAVDLVSTIRMECFSQEEEASEMELPRATNPSPNAKLWHDERTREGLPAFFFFFIMPCP